MCWLASNYRKSFHRHFVPDNAQIKKRVLISLGLLVGAKLLNITVPFMFKHAIDLLNSATGGKLNLVKHFNCNV